MLLFVSSYHSFPRFVNERRGIRRHFRRCLSPAAPAEKGRVPLQAAEPSRQAHLQLSSGPGLGSISSRAASVRSRSARPRPTCARRSRCCIPKGLPCRRSPGRKGRTRTFCGCSEDAEKSSAAAAENSAGSSRQSPTAVFPGFAEKKQDKIKSDHPIQPSPAAFHQETKNPGCRKTTGVVTEKITAQR